MTLMARISATEGIRVKFANTGKWLPNDTLSGCARLET